MASSNFSPTGRQGASDRASELKERPQSKPSSPSPSSSPPPPVTRVRISFLSKTAEYVRRAASCLPPPPLPSPPASSHSLTPYNYSLVRPSVRSCYIRIHTERITNGKGQRVAGWQPDWQVRMRSSEPPANTVTQIDNRKLSFRDVRKVVYSGKSRQTFPLTNWAPVHWIPALTHCCPARSKKSTD